MKFLFFNHSVGAATLEDYIGFIGIYNKYQKYIPNSIILGIDPWVLINTMVWNDGSIFLNIIIIQLI